MLGPTYTGHEETESTTETESHGTGDDCLDRARFHTSGHLLIELLDRVIRRFRITAYHLDHSLFLLAHAGILVSSEAATQRHTSGVHDACLE